MNTIVRTDNLSKKYKNKFAVENVSMKISKGEIYGFIGENGAGKTTIIRLLTGLATPTSGNYELFGVNNNNSNIYNVRSKMSAVVESPSIYTNLTAYENLYIQAQILGLKSYESLDEILTIIGLDYLKNDSKKAGNFSLGMKQRLGIGIALVGNPELIVLDEPMNGLDPEGIVEVRELILKLNKEKNISFIISSHILDELAKVATKYGFIHHGKIIKEITSTELAEECKSGLQIKVNDQGKALTVIKDKLQYTDFKTNGYNSIIIFDEVKINQLVKALDEDGIDVLEINNKNITIEEYYLTLMRGAQYV